MLSLDLSFPAMPSPTAFSSFGLVGMMGSGRGGGALEVVDSEGPAPHERSGCSVKN